MRRTFALAVFAVSTAAHSNDFPTVDRVEFVLECMHRHEDKQEFLYKCACVIDEIAKQYKYDDYVAVSSTSRYRDMAGERMGVFRDPENLQNDVRKYRETVRKASEQCGLPVKKR